MTACLLLIVFATSLLLTGRVRAYALRADMLDRPNGRSSHKVPTPRGGGLAFSAVILAVLTALVWIRPESRRLWIALTGGGFAVALVGWLDDRTGLSNKIRASVHLAAAAWAVAWLGGMPALDLGTWTLPLGHFGAILAVVGVVWAVNLFNFMDGIDGIAGSQAVTVSLATASLLWVAGDAHLAFVPAVVAAAVAGFLVWNWPPARIFMGDCGSGLLGFLLAAIALAGENRATLPLSAPAVLMAVFWVDATATLIRRVTSGEPWHQAHCSHAYQRLVKWGCSHRRVTLGVLAINVALTASAVLCVAVPPMAVAVLATATALLLVLWSWAHRLRPVASTWPAAPAFARVDAPAAQRTTAHTPRSVNQTPAQSPQPILLPMPDVAAVTESAPAAKSA